MNMENKAKVLRYLHIPRSSFYYRKILKEKDLKLKEKIEEVMNENPSYGHKRISMELSLGKKQILRVMKKFDLKPARGRRKPWKWDRVRGEASPNLLVSLFPLCPNHIWITDFTYLKWQNRWVYVCTVLDLFSRLVVGISIKTNHSSLLVSEALLSALANHSPPSIIHSDQGSEYKSKLFRLILDDHRILQSMSKKGSPWQNGYQESFFGNWKVDIGNVNVFKSLGELTAGIYRSIYYYNNLRIHTSLKMPPKRFLEKIAEGAEVKYNTNQEILSV